MAAENESSEAGPASRPAATGVAAALMSGRAAPVLWFGAVVGFVLPLCRRSINLSDEGYILLQALDMLEGKVLYRDMDAFVSPGIWFLLAGWFEIVEPSVIASRALSLFSFVATAGICFRIVDFTTRRSLAWVSTGLFLLMGVWAFPIWTWTFYSPFAVLFALCALERLLVFSREGRTRDVIWLGLWLGLAITFKQNYGTFALLASLAGLVLLQLTRRDAQPSSGLATQFGALALGGVAVGLPVFGYLIANDAVGAAFRSLVVHPFVFAGQHDIPYLGLTALFDSNVLGGTDRLTYGAASLYRLVVPADWLRELRLIERLHVGLYLLPPLFFAGATLSLWRTRAAFDRELALVALVAGAVFLGVFPRADYNHLVNVYQPVLVLMLVVVDRLARDGVIGPWLRSAGVRATAGVLATTYVLVAGYWYTGTLSMMDTPISGPRGGVLERAELAIQIDQLAGFARGRTRAGGALLTVPDLAMLNFLAQRSMPSPYYNLYQHHIAHDGGAGVVEGSRAHGTTFAVTRYNDFFSDRERLRDYAPVLFEYLDRDFDIEFSAGGDNFLFLTRRLQPHAPREIVRVLDRCEIEPAVATGEAERGNDVADHDVVDHEVRDHLLFTTLYQDQGDHHELERWAVESRCRVTLPNDPGLVFGVRPDYFPPRAASRGATLDFELWVEREGHAPERILSQSMPVARPAELSLVRPWPRERRVSLRRFAGQQVTFVFRTNRTGRVQNHPLAFRGYAAQWIDPRLLGSPAATQ